MALFHNHISKVQRSNGQNAIAASAYIGARALEMLDGTTADYRKKKGVCGNRIIAPSFCEKKKDVSAQWLWQEAEKAEKRKNSTVARRADLALPTEFTEEECFAVGYQYAQDIADRYNVVVDINFHDLSTNNPHIDMMWTTRVFDGESLKEKTRILDDKVTGPKEINWLREQWANRVNQVLVTYATSIDHRSYKEQGSEKIATKHLGRKVSALEKSGVETEIGNYNRQVSEYNKLIEEKEKLDTEIVQLEKEIQENQNDKFRDSTDGKSATETGGSELESRNSTDERSDKNIFESPSLISANATASRGVYAEHSASNQSATGTTERHFTRDIQFIRPSFDWANKASSREHDIIFSGTSIDSSTPKRYGKTFTSEGGIILLSDNRDSKIIVNLADFEMLLERNMYWQNLKNRNLSITKLENTNKIEEVLCKLSTYRTLEELLEVYEQSKTELKSYDKSRVLDFDDTDDDIDLFINL